jgi:hypothetical protein
MKNHLSMLGSIGAGAMFSFCGIGGSCEGSRRLGECLTVTLVLQGGLEEFLNMTYLNLRGNITRVGLASDELLPSLSTLTDDISSVPENLLASKPHSNECPAYFLFLHSPVKANWFSGFPSGIL